MPRPSLYPAHYYDENLVLRVPALLWLVMIMLVRHFIFVGLTFLPSAGDAMTYLRDLVEPIFLISDLVAAPVLFVAMTRKPGSPPWMRGIWRRGRVLLIAAALVYIVIWIAHFAVEQRWHFAALKTALFTSLILDLVVLVIVSSSPLIREVFRDFPPDR